LRKPGKAETLAGVAFRQLEAVMSKLAVSPAFERAR
jgi:hypothetical protein